MENNFTELGIVKGLGQIYEIDKVWYDEGLEKLRSIGANFEKITARNIAFARNNVPIDHHLNRRGNWIVEEIVFGLNGIKNPVIILKNGPVYCNAKKAAEATKSHGPFYIDEPELEMSDQIRRIESRWDRALTKINKSEMKLLKEGEMNPMQLQTFQLPRNETFRLEVEELVKIDIDKLSDPEYFNSLSGEMQTAAILLKDQVNEYANKVLRKRNIMMPVMILENKETRAHAQPLWIGSATPGCGSCIVGCICGNWMRGVKD